MKTNLAFACVPRLLILTSLGLGLGHSALPAGEVPLIQAGAVWKYSDTGADLGTGWRATAFNDHAWAAGPAQLGYGDGDEATVINGGPVGNRYITTYFRRVFVLNDPPAFSHLTLRLLRDDGAVVYLNGLEVFRNNLPTGPIGYTTLATSGLGSAIENNFITTTLPSYRLIQGTNVVAVEVHQVNGASSDVSFDLELIGHPGVPMLGHVVAWGSGGWGQNVVPEDLGPVVAVSAGMYHSMALKPDGTVVSWGGAGTDYQEAGFVPSGLREVAAISAGAALSIALKVDGTVTCWGLEYYAQVPAGLRDVIAVSAGGYHGLALQRSGRVVGWGQSEYGQISPPTNLTDVVAIAAGGHHSLALRANGTVVGFGYNGGGEASPPAGLSGVTAIAADNGCSVALRSNGTVVAWGIGAVTNVPHGLSNVVAISAGSGTACGLKRDGTVVAWGEGWSGVSNVPPNLAHALAVDVGTAHALALRSGSPPPSLAEAVDAPQLLWTTGGAAPWFSQVGTTHDGLDAAQSGPVPDFQESWMQTTVTLAEPTELSFWWKVSSGSGDYGLAFYTNGVVAGGHIDGEVDWEFRTVILPPGTHTLRWTFHNAVVGDEGATAGWVDQVTLAPAPLTLAEAVDAPHLTWITGGAVNWFPQTGTSHDGVDAAQGTVNIMDERSWIGTTVTGPARVGFHWKCSTRWPTYDRLAFYVDGGLMGSIPGDTDWQAVSFLVPAGTHVLKWVFEVNSEPTAGLYNAWLDQVTVEPLLQPGVSVAWMTNHPGGMSGLLHVDSSGNAYLAGQSQVLKFAPDGRRLWVAPFNRPGGGQGGMGWPTALTVNDAGTVFVTGYSSRVSADYDWMTITFDANGNLLWRQIFGGVNTHDTASAISVDAAGNVHVTGSENENSGHGFLVTLKYGSAGNLLWTARYRGDYDAAYGRAVAVDSAGNAYVIGTANSWRTLFDWAVLKYDREGNRIWAANFGSGEGDDQPCALALDAAGNLFITGLTRTNGLYHCLTAKYSPGGEVLWLAYDAERQTSGNGGQAIALDSLGNVCIAATGPPDGNNEERRGFATLKYDPSGHPLWAARFFGTYHGGTGFALDRTDNIYITAALGEYADQAEPVTIKYDPQGNQVWAMPFPLNGRWGEILMLGLGPDASVYTAGTAYQGGADYEYLLVKYAQAPASPSLAVALDWAGPWTTGSKPWFGQTAVTADGVDAAQSATNLTCDDHGWLKTTVTGPGTIRFRWKAQIEGAESFVAFYVAGGSGTWPQAIYVHDSTDWRTETSYFGPGSHDLFWVVYGNCANYDEQAIAWLDQVEILPLGAGGTNCASTPAGLIAWWRAEGNADDAAGSNSGALFNNAGFSPGNIGQAFAFDDSSYVEVPDAPSLRLENELTIEFWVRREQPDGIDYIVEKGGDWTGGEQNYAVALHTSAYDHCLHFLFNGGWRGGGRIADTDWHHCAVVARHGDANPTLYVDGVPQPILFGEGAETINLHPSTRPLHIGAQIDPHSGWFYYHHGGIDELSIYNRALSAAEIQAVYQAGRAGKCLTPPRLPPSVALVSPTNGAVFLRPALIPLVAEASDLDGHVVTVEFFLRQTSLGQVTAPLVGRTNLFRLLWTNTLTGFHEVTAVATDNNGKTNRSAPLVVRVVRTNTPPRFTLTDLGALEPDGLVSARAINDAGEVVGVASAGDAGHAFLYRDGRMTDLGTLTGTRSDAADINQAGVVAGTWDTDDWFGSRRSHLFVYSNGLMQAVPEPAGARILQAEAINDAGVVVGVIIDTNGDWRGLVWDQGDLRVLGTLPGGASSYALGINNAGLIAGCVGMAGGGYYRAVLFAGDDILDLGLLPDTYSALAVDLNDAGQVVGHGTAANSTLGFLYANGVLAPLPMLSDAAHMYPTTINNAGQIAGSSVEYADGEAGFDSYSRAFLLSDGVLEDLNDLVAPATGWVLTGATDLNDRGQIVGDGTYNGRLRGWLLTPIVPQPFVTRQISGQQVELTAVPSAATSVYAIEDQPPAGWVVDNISHGGVFDAATGKVKFGPFYDAELRTLRYAVLPPPGTQGVFAFTGKASADGVNSLIGGDQFYALAGLHPADLEMPAWQMAVSEVTAYGAAWRRGSNWSVEPVVIPMDYVTRAAMLWRAGECYEVAPAMTNAPLWWVNCDVPRGAGSPVAGAPVRNLPVTERRMAHAFIPGEPVGITVSVAPAGAWAYVVEERVPSYWSATNVSDGGVWDAVQGVVRWGLFLDSASRTLSYQATPSLTASGAASFRGLASFDGTSYVIAGPGEVVEGCRLRVEPTPLPNQFRITLAGRPGVRLLIEASSDLVNWTDLGEVITGAASVLIVDPEAALSPQRFYRVSEAH